MARIRYYPPVSGLVGREEDAAEAANVRAVLAYIQKTYGRAAEKAAKSSLIVVNDVSIGLYQGFDTVLKADNTVGFLPLCGGG